MPALASTGSAPLPLRWIHKREQVKGNLVSEFKFRPLHVNRHIVPHLLQRVCARRTENPWADGADEKHVLLLKDAELLLCTEFHPRHGYVCNTGGNVSNTKLGRM